MNKLLAGLERNTPNTFTTNGALAHTTTYDACLDLFSRVGGLRRSPEQAVKLFRSAYAQNPEIAVRILLWTRDCRGGAGERNIFRTVLTELATKYDEEGQNIVAAIIPKVAELGRWDDLFCLKDTPMWGAAVNEIAHGLHSQNGLCAKWMPRKGPVAASLAKAFGIKPGQYRALVVSLTNVVEQKMCAKQWESIEFGKIPGLAAARYQKAFKRNAPDAYAAYTDALTKGEQKINASSMFPHDVLQGARRGDNAVATEQWKALPDYMANTDERILAMVDVSGSMSCKISDSSSVTCMDVAVALGLYVSERNNGPFRDACVTFTDRPQLVHLPSSNDLRTRDAAMRTRVGYNTNIDAAFNMILDTAVMNNVPASDMPSILLIMSDMQFDSHDVSARYNKTTHQGLKQRYAAAGYTMPRIVYWNLNARNGTSPVTRSEIDTALVSGFSPGVMKAILAAEHFSPVSVMLQAIMVDRYALWN